MITGKIESGGVFVSSLTFPAITTPARIRSCSMIESSSNARSSSSSLRPPSSKLFSSSVFLLTSSSAESDSSFSVTSATSALVNA